MNSRLKDFKIKLWETLVSFAKWTESHQGLIKFAELIFRIIVWLFGPK